MLVTEPGCERMAVKSLKTGGLVVCCLMALISKVSLSNANKNKLRKGETGRYMYYSDTQELNMYCRYCPQISMLFESEDVNRKYLVGSCVEKNSPLEDKLDQDEIKNGLYPVCIEGEIPSCALPQNPLGGVWKCDESEKPDKVLVYKTCQLQCDPRYKKVGEGKIYCNESRKFDPPWTETTCTNEHESTEDPFQAHYESTEDPFQAHYESTEDPFQAHYASKGFPFLAICVSVAVVVLICVLVTIVYFCRKYPQQCENAFSRIKRGFKKTKSTVLSSKIPESTVIIEITDNVQSTSSEKDTQMLNTNIYIDPSKKPLLSQEPNRVGNEKDPTENDDQLSYTDGSYNTLDCINNEIEIKKAHIMAFSDSEAFPYTFKYGENVDQDEATQSSDKIYNSGLPSHLEYGFMTLNPISIHSQGNVHRPRPEGVSFSPTCRNEIPTPQGVATEAHQKEKRDSQETLSKEFMRDPKFCDTRAHRDLILEWEKRGANTYCEDIVKVVEEMEGLGSSQRSNQDERRNHVYALMREKDVRIGDIVYYVSQNQRQDHANILHQIQKVHPDCNFCKSLYGDMAIH